MNPENMSNNQIPGTSVPTTNNGILNNNTLNTGNVVTNNTIPSSAVPNNGVQYMQSPVASSEVPQNNTVVTETSTSVPQTEVENASSSAQAIQEHEVSQILSSSFESKEKVNLLTPEQKAELVRKREEALLEKQNYQPAPVSKFKRFFMFLFLIALVGITIFLPEINAFILSLQSTGGTGDDSKITTGTMECVRKKVDDNYDISYTYQFSFTDSKLKKLSYYEAVTGDAYADADDLNEKLASCELLKSVTSTISGIRVNCSLSSGTLTREQIFDYTSINTKEAVSAYIEAGGEYHGEFALDSNIDDVEMHMNSVDYSCERYQ